MIESLLNTKHWHISEQYYNRVGLLAMRLMEQGKSLDVLKSAPSKMALPAEFLLSENTDRSFQTVQNQKGDEVAVIPINGVMNKQGDLCSYGTIDLANMIHEANSTKGISAIIITLNTPGGSSNSIEVLDRAVAASALPIVGLVDDMAASAGLWVASAIARKGKVLVDSLMNSSMGSIGTLYFHEQVVAKLAMEGTSIEIIRAPQSVDKARVNMLEPLTKELREEISGELYSLTESFKTAVITNYGSDLKIDTSKLFTGGMFDGKTAIEIGLAHDQGDLSAAFSLAMDIAKTSTKTTFTNLNTNMNIFEKVGLSYSIAQKLSSDELNNLASAVEKFEASQKAVSEMTAELETMKLAETKLEVSLSDRDTTIAGHVKMISELNAKLDKAPAAAATTAVADGDAASSASEKNYETAADRELSQYKANLKIV